MKLIIVCLVLAVILVAGCASQPPSQPAPNTPNLPTTPTRPDTQVIPPSTVPTNPPNPPSNPAPSAGRLATAQVYAYCAATQTQYSCDYCERNVSDLGCSASFINSLGYEDSPFVSLDGTHLYFFYTRWNLWPLSEGKDPYQVGPHRPGHVGNIDGYKDGNFYGSQKRADGTWSTPTALFVGCCGMTVDGNVFYYNNNQDIYSIDAISKEIVLMSGLNSAWAEDNPHVLADGSRMYWSSDRPGGFGGKDIWYADRLLNGSWSEPINAGPGINSPAAEDTFWTNGAGAIAYFGRDLDVFTSQLSGGSWQQATQVVFNGPRMNLGEPSLTEDLQTMFLAHADTTVKHIEIVQSRKLSDGTWSQPAPV